MISQAFRWRYMFLFHFLILSLSISSELYRRHGIPLSELPLFIPEQMLHSVRRAASWGKVYSFVFLIRDLIRIFFAHKTTAL